ncbi:MAG: DUF3750 domain-containing protein [Kofleriaceae bacterium]|nr:DUF3750 domain-containing protein [Kofleriaceae bacterium]MCB9575265.1 DUF3750 domain-containing protein [Kofleriaceae bacterium]
MSRGAHGVGVGAAALALAVATSACVVLRRPVVAPGGDDAAVIVASSALGAPLDHIARHPWFAVREAGSSRWVRWEVGASGEAPPLEDLAGGGGDVRVHAVWRGARAERAIACLEREAPPWLAALHYRAWPGPNSNTFVDVMLRRCGLHASLAATAIGKDYRGAIGVSWTTEGTGVQLSTWLFGLRIGLKEGIQVHILGLPLGIDLWPPALIVPLGPGRIGFDDR